MATPQPTIWIYGLQDPRTGKLRYIGKSYDPLVRLRQHYQDKRNYPCQQWVQGLLKAGKEPKLVWLEEVSESTWPERERAWVERLLADGTPLLNDLRLLGRRGGRVARPEAERFWEKVDKTNGPLSLVRGHWSRCWIWTGNTFKGQYGHFLSGKRSDGSRRDVLAHRFSYESVYGFIPKGLQLDHLCRQRLCTRPSHLEPVTAWENNFRGNGPSGLNARKTCCPQGHPYDLWDKQGRRYCTICLANNQARFRAKKRLALVEAGIPLPLTNAEKEHCPRGHVYDGVGWNGSRICTVCEKEGKRRRYAEKRLALGYAYTPSRPAEEVAIQCKYGHPVNEENTYWYRGVRHCRQCGAEKTRQYRARQRQVHQQA